MKKMSKLRRALVSGALAVGLVGGGAVAANAATWTAGPEKWQWDRSGSYCGVWAYVDYNWWEESWFGGSHRDGWERQWWALC